jgi:hypothetical protein
MPESVLGNVVDTGVEASLHRKPPLPCADAVDQGRDVVVRMGAVECLTGSMVEVLPIDEGDCSFDRRFGGDVPAPKNKPARGLSAVERAAIS